MATPAPAPPRYEFYFADLDTLIQVEDHPAGVIIRASRDSFSPRRKTAFIRELAAEGFIADDFRWLPSADFGQTGGPRWIIDHSWLQPDPAADHTARRFVVHLIGWSGVLWAVLLAWLLLRSSA